MAMLQLRFAGTALAQPARARLREGGIDLTALPMSVGTATGEGLAKTGETLSKLGGAMEAAQARAETEQRTLEAAQAKAAAAIRSQNARTRYREALGEAERYAAENPDPSKARESFMGTAEALQGAVAESLPEAERGQFEADAYEMRVSRAAQVQRAGVARLQQSGLATLNDSLRESAEDAARARNPVERLEAEARRDKALGEAVGAGFLRPDAADGLLRRFSREVDQIRARDRIRAEPHAAATEIPLPPAFPHLDESDRAALEGEAWQAADAQADAVVQADVAMARAAETGMAARLRGATDGFFGAAAGEAQAGEGEGLAGFADLLHPDLLAAARTVGLTVGGGRDDPGELDALLTGAGESDPGDFEVRAARSVAGGRLSAGSFLALIRANRQASAATPEGRAWRATRADAVELLTPPDLGALAPGLPDLTQARRAALAELDAWAAANPKAGPGAARAEASAITARHRGAMVDRLIAALPRPPALEGTAAPYGPELLDAAEGEVLDALEDGAFDAAEAARRLRLLEAWRWVGEDVAPEEPAAPAGMPGRRRR